MRNVPEWPGSQNERQKHFRRFQDSPQQSQANTFPWRSHHWHQGHSVQIKEKKKKLNYSRVQEVAHKWKVVNYEVSHFLIIL